MRHPTTYRLPGHRVQVGVALGFWLLAAAATGAATVTLFPVPSATSDLLDIAAGPDGNLWFTERSVDRIGRITPAGVVTEFPLAVAGSGPYAIAAGPDGNLWFTENSRNQIGRITPAGVITEFPVPTLSSGPMGIAPGSDGNLWFTENRGNKIGRVTPRGVVTEFPLPQAASLPTAICPGPDGNIWFVLGAPNRIGRITPSGAITEFSVAFAPTAGIAAGGDGNVWFTNSDKISRITPDGVVTDFVVGGSPYLLATDDDGNLWFSSQSDADAGGRMTTAGAYTTFSEMTGADALAFGPDGNIWFTHTNEIGRLKPAPAKGDLDLDGRSDLLFRSINLVHNKVWFMNGVARVTQADIVPNAASPDWVMRGADDFDSASSPGAGRDFATDLVFWNQASGNVEFWLMNGVARVGAPVPLTGGAVLPPNWDLSATAEFNHDGKPDIVWRDFTTQQLVIWTMNGTAKTGEIIPSPIQAVDGNWIVVAAADYNNDGQTDFLWYNFTSGKIVTWYMDANVVRTSGQFTTPAAAGDANWKVVASADYSGASGLGTPPLGSPDIVWRNETSGQQVVWHLDFASTRVYGEFTTPMSNSPSSAWTIVGPR